MTAGQGDQQGQQQGQPQGGQPPAWPAAPPQQGGQPPYGWAPPGQQPPAHGPYGQPPQAPPYGQDPQGQNPYGQNPYGQNPYAYPSAPTGSGWGPDAPRPMERPVTVRAGVGAFLAALVLSAIGMVATVANWDQALDWALAQEDLTLDDPSLDGMPVAEFAELALQMSIAFSVLVIVLESLFIWFAWKGRNWARIVLWVLGGLALLSVPFSATASGPLPFVTALTWFQIGLTFAGVVLLALKPSNDWYRFRKWQRSTGQG
jgi:hypothetical protein